MTAEPTGHVVELAVEDDLPGLRMWSLAVQARPGRSNEGLRSQLRLLSDRYGGAHAIALRHQAIPHAYRVFFRHVGLDPDSRRTPIEEAVIERLRNGGFGSHGLVHDALLIALVETGVPVWALDEEAIVGHLQLRPATEQDTGVPIGRLAIADSVRALGELFGPLVAGVDPGPATQHVRLVAIAVEGVPQINVDEALFTAARALEGS